MRIPLRHPTWRQPHPHVLAALVLALVMALWVAACSSAPATRTSQDQPGSSGRGRLVDIGGRHLYLACQGTGTPPVVFLAGLGDSGQTAWAAVWGQVARSTRACIYDRAGLGRSDPGPTPASYQGAADDLDALLRSGKVPGPYLLVGHSLGGLLARLYAEEHPAEVAGVVLVDATPVGWFPTVQRLLPAALRGPLAHNPEGFDLGHGLASLTPLDRPGALGRRPLAVLWAPNQPPPGLPAATTQELGRHWETEQARLGGCRRQAACSGSPAAATTSSATSPSWSSTPSTRSCARRNAPRQATDAGKEQAPCSTDQRKVPDTTTP